MEFRLFANGVIKRVFVLSNSFNSQFLRLQKKNPQSVITSHSEEIEYRYIEASSAEVQDNNEKTNKTEENTSDKNTSSKKKVSSNKNKGNINASYILNSLSKLKKASNKHQMKI